MTSSVAAPLVSVIIPTYNRQDLLEQTLHNLVRQSIPSNRFEVIVSDDGSTDASAQVVEAYAERLCIKYHYQDDLGNRVALARNSGVRLAEAPLLVFLDTGALVGPDFLVNHLAAHAAGRRAVAGYAYAYNPKRTVQGLAEALAAAPPEDVLLQFAAGDGLRDARHDALSECGFDLGRAVIPWMLFWTMNCSIRADDFWNVGGFAEEFTGWGLEDIEFAFRVHRQGLALEFNRDAWVLHAPHERDWPAELGQLTKNVQRFLDRHPEPVVEIGWALITRYQLAWPWELEFRSLSRIAAEIATTDISGELATTLAMVNAGERVAIFGVGGNLPAGAAPSYLMDFDQTLLAQTLALAGSETVGHHSIGLRTPLADQCVDTVIITSRLEKLWQRWGPDILAEAQRVGRQVRTFELGAPV